MKETFLKTVMEGAGIGRKKAEYLWDIGLRLPAEQHQGEPVARYSMDQTGCEELDPDGHWVRYDDMKHTDPGEVERLREQIKEWQETSVHWMHKCDTLRVQLAERDALLREWLELHRRQQQPVTLHERTEAALSASAEPSAAVERDERDERAAFEAWFKDHSKDWPFPSESIKSIARDNDWLVWKASAALERKS